jgi:peptide/nickel transport system permease protein
MTSFILKRLATGVILVWIVLTLIFLMLQAVPGDPAVQLLTGAGGGAVSPEAVEAMRQRLGLDLPVLQQYWNYLTGVLTGDLGTAFRDGREVSTMILERLPRTLELVLLAVLLALLIGVPLGSLAARKGGWADSTVSVLTSIGMSVPVYIIGTIFVLVFAIKLGWFPSGGFRPITEDPVGHFVRLLLPAVALSLGIISIVSRMARSAVLENLQQDWVRTARSWGIGKKQVFNKYVLRNSLTPVATVTGLQIGSLLGGTVLIEQVFIWPGLSSLLIEAVVARDYPVVQGIVIILSVIFIVINLLVDILYGYLDPRVRTS